MRVAGVTVEHLVMRGEKVGRAACVNVTEGGEA